MNVFEQFLSLVPIEMKTEISQFLNSGNMNALLQAINSIEDSAIRRELNSKLVLVAFAKPFRRGIQ